MELLASISNPTRSGKSVSAAKFMICRGGRLLSRILNWLCFRSLMNLLCLSVTVKITFTSSDRLLKVWIGSVSSAAEAESAATAFAFGGVCGTAEPAGCVCAAATQTTSVKANKTARTHREDISATLLVIIVWETNPQYSLGNESSIPNLTEKFS